MNRKHIISLILLTTFGGCLTTGHESSDYSALFDGKGSPTTTLCALFSTLHLTCGTTISEINGVAQANLLRKGERWEIEKKWESQRAELLPLLKELGLWDAVTPAKLIAAKELADDVDSYNHFGSSPHLTISYDYVLVLGALQSRIEKRLAYLEHLAKTYPSLLAKNAQGKVPTIVLLTSARPLDPEKEASALQAGLTTEADVMQAALKKSTLGNYAWALLISAPMKIDAKGTVLRPTTDDTVKAWLTKKPTPGRCLIISDQPFVLRQTLVLKTLLPKEFILDAAGPAADESMPIAVFLDELARTIYQIAKLQGKA